MKTPKRRPSALESSEGAWVAIHARLSVLSNAGSGALQVICAANESGEPSDLFAAGQSLPLEMS